MMTGDGLEKLQKKAADAVDGTIHRANPTWSKYMPENVKFWITATFHILNAGASCGDHGYIRIRHPYA